MTSCLVVDDSRMIRRVASRILKDLKFETSEAENGQIALDMCRMDMPDAILLCLLYTSPSPRDATLSRMPSSA